MKAQEELEALDALYVADSPYDTQKNIAERIKWLLDNESLGECPKGGDHLWEAFDPNGLHGSSCHARCCKCGFRPALEQNESLFYEKPE